MNCLSPLPAVRCPNCDQRLFDVVMRGPTRIVVKCQRCHKVVCCNLFTLETWIEKK